MANRGLAGTTRAGGSPPGPKESDKIVIPPLEGAKSIAMLQRGFEGRSHSLAFSLCWTGSRSAVIDFAFLAIPIMRDAGPRNTSEHVRHHENRLRQKRHCCEPDFGTPSFDVFLVFQVFRGCFAHFVPTLEYCGFEHVNALFPSAYCLRSRKFAFAVGFEHVQTGQGFRYLSSIQTGADFIAPYLRRSKPASGFAMIPAVARPIDDGFPVGIGSCDVVEAAVAVRFDKMTNLGDCLPRFVGRRAAAPVEPSIEEFLGVVERVALFPRKDSKLHAVFARRRNEPEPLRHPRRLTVIVPDVHKRVLNEGLDAFADVLR